MSRQEIVGVGAGAAHLGVDRVVDLGPLHPSAHGAYRLRLTVGGDHVITSAEPLVGHLHRGAEKLFEVRDYRQVLTLANRHDWLAAFCNEVVVAQAVERMTGMDVPARALWLRTLLCELNRLLAHLVFLTPLTRSPQGPPTEATATLQAATQAVQGAMEEASGGRIHFMASRIGGLREDVPAGWTDHVTAVLSTVDGALTAIQSTVDSAVFVEAHQGIGVLSTEDAQALGVTGPAGRASGLDFDLRRDDPTSAYGDLEITPVLATEGDALARVRCLVGEVAQSLRLSRACLAALPPGPVNLRLPKAIKAPEGSVYTWGEAPLGVSGVHLSSRGEKTPWRLKLRTPSFNNIQALAALLPGTPVSALPAVLGSFAVIVGDVDK
ncbi:NADH-quinone oxidoreductase subunit D [Crossiella equi]|uniref:NADH-quinone oxidoreductase subunit D n=1 Tax=Crossiella equi TaxID=130796 RepID=A0ABS5AF41_9PSEU|nr:NADH-quinone oxidoreductase subunit D [Crossiella equi]MBP2475203.1 NADH-quinone oxidoreductase subunit D [Crossiella equi]